ncbi:MAG: alpha/beta fold hydrolase [Acidobacteria bacterium]|nr:alpha/beta fold hydrolase [Acidobacteriota bacterium]
MFLLTFWMFETAHLQNGLDFFYEKKGDGPVTVLISGLGHDHHIWAPLIERLPLSFGSTLCFDARGIGQSGDDGANLTTRIMAEDVIQLLDALAIPKANVVGISLGSLVTQELAAHFPDRVERVVLLATTMGGSAHIAPDQEVLAYFATAGQMDEKTRLAKGLQLAMSESSLKDAQVQERVGQVFSGPSAGPEIRRRQGIAGMFFDSTGWINQIHAPVLVLHGAKDRVVPVVNGENLARKIGASYHVQSDIGHLMILENPEWVAAQLVDFFQKD